MTSCTAEIAILTLCATQGARADSWLRKDLAYFCSLYFQYGKDSFLLGPLAYNCGPGMVNKSSILKNLKA
ncbi:MAG: hypothetical protein K2L17_03600 [Muribaculaceae bacterium]|nr:hypothetical protein [Muribaculaceae bacterium]